MATYITSVEQFDLTVNEQERGWFANDLAKLARVNVVIPQEVHETALRCWKLAKCVSSTWKCGVEWRELVRLSDDERVIRLNEIVAAHQKGAGYRALKRKVGKEAAKEIISR